MQFVNAVRSGLVNYANFRSRASRSSYWYWVLFTMIVSLVTGNNQTLNLITTVLLFPPSIAVGVRRMHDVNHSGWWILCPIYNLVLACQPGYEWMNDYGPPEPPMSLG